MRWEIIGLHDHDQLGKVARVRFLSGRQIDVDGVKADEHVDEDVKLPELPGVPPSEALYTALLKPQLDQRLNAVFKSLPEHSQVVDGEVA